MGPCGSRPGAVTGKLGDDRQAETDAVVQNIWKPKMLRSTNLCPGNHKTPKTDRILWVTGHQKKKHGFAK